MESLHMNTARSSATLLALLVVALPSAEVPAVNWEQQKPEILRHYRALIQIDTSNPPGNETGAVEYLKEGV